MTIPTVDQARRAAAEALTRPGDWLTAAQRVDVWREARAAATDPLDLARRDAVSPHAVTGAHGATEHLPAAAVETAHRLASDPGRLSRRWADQQIAALGEETYTEVVGVVSIATTIDTYRRALGEAEVPLPSPDASRDDGEPAGRRPDDVGDVGAWVSQSTGPTRANVSRALSLLPETQAVWRDLVDSHYSRGVEFMSMVWHRALSRPQIEMVASRTTSLSECFY